MLLSDRDIRLAMPSPLTMPDAERTLQIVTWLMLVKQGRNPEGMKVAATNS